MSEYLELAPPARLADAVECLWSMRHTGAAALHRVTPDGCADIIYTGGRLVLVGAMTAWRDYPLADGDRLYGIRFRPGAWGALVGAPAAEVTDQLAPLDGLWGRRAGRLSERLAEARSAAHAFDAISAEIPSPQAPDPVARAFAWMERRGGIVSMDEMARHAGISARQLRRVALERTGLPPKFLARVLRFRRAQRLLASGRGSLAGLALDCGYYDQAHFINEFREFSGRTPSANGRFFQSAAAGSAVSSAT